MKFVLSIFAVMCVAFFSLLACSSEKPTAGIEIGNPEVADKDTTIPLLALSANFSVDYSDVMQSSKVEMLLKAAAKDEPVLIDTFNLVLTELRDFSSYYIYVPHYNADEGFLLWPYEKAPDETLNISFTDGSSVDETFSEVDLHGEGLLKEIAIGLKPKSGGKIYGRILVGKTYVPFEYSLDAFQSMMLRYHYTQIEMISETKANLSVVFRARYFVDGINLSKAEIADDGIIHIDASNNDSLWQTLNRRLIPSFQSLRYDYVNELGEKSSDYVYDIWLGIVDDIGDNIVSNYNFAEGSKDWILMNQFGGKSDTTIIHENEKEQIMKVTVSTAGKYSYSVQLIHEDIALVEGIQYKCVFTIWSDKEGQITARIGDYATYETLGFQEHLQIGTLGKSQEVTFVAAASSPFGRFELNLGSAERTFWIKDIKILRIEEL